MTKMNVLQLICPAGLYGAERWILALAKNLDRSKVNCHLAITYESRDQNIEVIKKFKCLNLGAHKVKMRGRFDPRVISRLFKLLKQHKINIIHSHGN